MDVSFYKGAKIIRPSYDGTQNCASVGVDAMYLEGPGAEWEERNFDRIAETVCTGCTFLAECAEYGIKHEHYGVWGGLSPSKRREIRRRLNISVIDPYLVATYGKA